MRHEPVIDKVEIRVPSAVLFTRNFGHLYSEFSRDSRVFRPAQHYARSGDLRPLGYQAILHVHCVHGRAGDHKLELIDTGEMSYLAMQREVTRIFQIDPCTLRVMRVDLAADVEGVLVQWFARNVRAKFKQWVAEIGTIEYAIAMR